MCMLVCFFHQADSKLREEEKRALRYLETRRDCNSVQAVSITTGLRCGIFISYHVNGYSMKLFLKPCVLHIYLMYVYFPSVYLHS